MRFLFASFWMLTLFVSQVWATEKLVVLDVATMVCGPDPHSIKSTLSSLAGVSEVKISLADKTATVKFDDEKSSVDQMLSAMAGAGYASLVKPQ
jgi:periplasmic mercuric ion binding protein